MHTVGRSDAGSCHRPDQGMLPTVDETGAICDVVRNKAAFLDGNGRHGSQGVEHVVIGVYKLRYLVPYKKAKLIVVPKKQKTSNSSESTC